MKSTSAKTAGRKGVLTTVVLAVAFIAVILSGFIYVMMKPRMMSEGALRAHGLFLFERVRDVGEFSLLDDNGKAFGPSELKGRWSLLFFGFTYCPDVCPTTLALLSQFYSKLPADIAADTQIILVSVDPGRDTPEKLHDYVRYFNPQFRAVTGEFMALQKFATAVNSPFTKTPGGGDNYQVEHSGNVVLMNPDGHYMGFFKSPLTLDNLAKTYESVHRAH